MAKQTVKKRSSIREKSLLSPPAGFDNKKYSGRWVAEHRLNARSDGYESRGFQPWKNQEGNIVKAGDLVWCYMTKEDALAHKKELYEAARDQMVDLQNSTAEADSRLAFEIEQAGGKLETTIKVE